MIVYNITCMSEMTKKTWSSERLLRLFAILILTTGGVLRLIVYLQNRNLIIDEANLVRNIYERSFAGLATPLSYEQYAPPIFLWIVKLCASTLGYSELALKIYPFFAGIAALFIFYLLLRLLIGGRVIWYAAVLFSVSPILIRYSSELKQYMPDVFITLSLLYLALKVQLKDKSVFRFVLLWFLIGSVAIWSCMPSAFILAGVGCYYGLQCLRKKDYKQLLPVVALSGLWVMQFLCYYLIILKPQISSSYLQNFHQYDFLFATPSNGGEWMHNWSVFNRLVKQFADVDWFVHLNVLFMVIGVFVLVGKYLDRAGLLLVPIVSLLIAAALNQYSLLPRVALFSLPLLLLLAVAGLDWLAYSKFLVLRAAVIVMMAACAYAGINHTLNTGRPYKFEQLTEGFEYLRQEHISGDYVYLHHASGAAFRYYTQIHPDREKWNDFKTAEVLPWYTNYDSLAWQMRYIWKNEKPVAFLYTNISEEELDIRTSNLLVRFVEIKHWGYPYVRCYLYDPKP